MKTLYTDLKNNKILINFFMNVFSLFIYLISLRILYDCFNADNFYLSAFLLMGTIFLEIINSIFNYINPTNNERIDYFLKIYFKVFIILCITGVSLYIIFPDVLIIRVYVFMIACLEPIKATSLITYFLMVLE